MSESNQSYKKLAIPYFKEVFDIIDEVLTAYDVPYYLIGVNAISLELLKKGSARIPIPANFYQLFLGF